MDTLEFINQLGENREWFMKKFRIWKGTGDKSIFLRWLNFEARLDETDKAYVYKVCSEFHARTKKPSTKETICVDGKNLEIECSDDEYSESEDV